MSGMLILPLAALQAFFSADLVSVDQRLIATCGRSKRPAFLPRAVAATRRRGDGTGEKGYFTRALVAVRQQATETSSVGKRGR